MIIRKYETADKTKTTKYLESAWPNTPIKTTLNKLTSQMVETEGNRTLILDDNGDIKGVGIWVDKGPLPTPCIAYLSVTPFNLSTYMRMVYEIIKDSQKEGYSEGYVPLYDKSLVELLKTQWAGLDIKPVGIDVETNEPSTWVLFIKYDDALAKLEKVI